MQPLQNDVVGGCARVWKSVWTHMGTPQRTRAIIPCGASAERSFRFTPCPTFSHTLSHTHTTTVTHILYARQPSDRARKGAGEAGGFLPASPRVMIFAATLQSSCQQPLRVTARCQVSQRHFVDLHPASHGSSPRVPFPCARPKSLIATPPPSTTRPPSPSPSRGRPRPLAPVPVPPHPYPCFSLER